MKLQPKLIEVSAPPEPEGAVIVLHGGARRREEMAVSPTQLSVLRMVPIAKRIARESRGRLAVYRLLNSRRGWETSHTPVDDVSWALREIASAGGRVPTCLVGHSLGGRAAILSAERPDVACVVALAPWVYPTDVPRGVDGKAFLIVHGDRDRIASSARSKELARRLAASSAASVGYVSVRGGKHAMLRRHGVFSGLASAFVRRSLLGDDAPSSALDAVRHEELMIEV